MKRSSIVELAQSVGFPRISLYFSIHPDYPRSKENHIRFSNALKKAAEELGNWGFKNAGQFLEQSIGNEKIELAQESDRGVAVFIEDRKIHQFYFPHEFADIAFVGQRYYILPLLNRYGIQDDFYLLSVTKGAIQFFHGNEGEMSEIVSDDFPRSFMETKAETFLQNDLGHHVRGSRTQPAGGLTAKYHAAGTSPEDYEAVELDHFISLLSKSVDSYLVDKAAPLVLAAGPRLLGRLRQDLKYRHLAKEHIQRNPHSLRLEELRENAFKIAENAFLDRRQKPLSDMKAYLAGANVLGSIDLQELMIAAEDGRIADLFIRTGKQSLGRYDNETRQVFFDESPKEDREDLYNLLALKVLEHAGHVAVQEDGFENEKASILGLFRY